MQPYDYTIEQPDFGKTLLSGLQIGQGFSQIRKQEAAEQAAIDEKAKQEALLAQYNTDLNDALTKPTASGFAALTAKYPQQREAFKQSWDMLSTEERDSDFKAGVQAFSAIQNGNIDAAKSMIEERITADKNAGEDPTEWEQIKAQLERDPKSTAGYIGLVLSSVDPDKWSKIATEQRTAEESPYKLSKLKGEAEEAPFKVSEAKAKAEKAAVDSKFAESNAAIDLKKKGWDITKLQEDIKINKENARIAALNAATSRETNVLKRQENQIKLQDMIRERDEKVNAKAFEAQNAASTFSNTIDIINDVLSDEDTLRAAIGTSAWRGAIPGSKARGMAGKIEQLQNAVAATNLDKIKGAMSDKDIAFLKNIESNLDRYQDEDAFIKELNRVGNSLIAAENRLANKNGMPVNKRPEFGKNKNITVDW